MRNVHLGSLVPTKDCKRKKSIYIPFLCLFLRYALVSLVFLRFLSCKCGGNLVYTWQPYPQGSTCKMKTLYLIFLFSFLCLTGFHSPRLVSFCKNKTKQKKKNRILPLLYIEKFIFIQDSFSVQSK